MTEEEKKESDQKTEKPVAKGSAVKFVLMGLIGALVVAGIGFGTMMFLGGEKASVEESHQEPKETDENLHANTDKSGAASVKSTKNYEGSEFEDALAFNVVPSEEELMAEMQESGTVMENIENSLEFLDVGPETFGVEAGEERMSADDSIEQVKWFDAEKAVLARREAEIIKKDKEQRKLERKLNKQILRIEQAESARISALAKLYDAMEPRAVAKLVANLDDNTVVSIIPRMKQKNASSVLAMMPPKRAAKLSKKLITISDK